jgi:hypothetical protein
LRSPLINWDLYPFFTISIALLQYYAQNIHSTPKFRRHSNFSWLTPYVLLLYNNLRAWYLVILMAADQLTGSWLWQGGPVCPFVPPNKPQSHSHLWAVSGNSPAHVLRGSPYDLLLYTQCLRVFTQSYPKKSHFSICSTMVLSFHQHPCHTRQFFTLEADYFVLLRSKTKVITIFVHYEL